MKYKRIDIDCEIGTRFTFLKGLKKTDEYFLINLMDFYELKSIPFLIDALKTKSKKGLNVLEKAELRVLKRLISVVLGEID
jgi:hypothetical protein